MFTAHFAARKSVYDSFPPSNGRLSDAFAEAHRSLAVFETVRNLDTLSAFSESVFALRAALNMGGQNPHYDVHYTRALALDATRRAYLAKQRLVGRLLWPLASLPGAARIFSRTQLVSGRIPGDSIMPVDSHALMDSVTIYALLTADETACAETALCAACLPSCGGAIEASADADAVRGAWADCTGNDALACANCGVAA